MSDDTTMTVAASAGDDVEVVPNPDETESASTPTLRGYRQRTAEIKFTRGDYEGMWLRTWINCPRSLVTRLGSPEEDVSARAFCDFVVDHNLQWTDGTRLPVPLTPSDVKHLDVVLVNKVVRLGIEEIQKAAGINPT